LSIQKLPVGRGKDLPSRAAASPPSSGRFYRPASLVGSEKGTLLGKVRVI